MSDEQEEGIREILHLKQMQDDKLLRRVLQMTGPKTTIGKGRSRMNALKHGLRATDELFLVHLKRTEREVFEEFRAALHGDYKPITTQEKLLVDRIAIQNFRLFRLYDLEYLAECKSRRDPLCRESILPHLERFARYDSRVDGQLRVLHNRLRQLYGKRGDHSLSFFSAKD
jgi:hypothetical protein